MKKIAILSILQVLFFSVLAILATIQFVGSIIQAGEFCSWQVGFGLLVATTFWLVILAVKEAKKELEK